MIVDLSSTLLRTIPGGAATGPAWAIALLLAALSLAPPAGLSGLPTAAAAIQPPSRSQFAASGARRVDLRVADTTVEAVIQLLRSQHCAAVSFIPAPGDQRLSLDLRQATVSAALRELAARKPGYRAETIGGREVLYPVTPEFQAPVVLPGETVAPMGRYAAADWLLPILRKEVPSLSGLVAPDMVGNLNSPLYTESVSLRMKGRVIDYLVDLLGSNPRIYFEFETAPSGLPILQFDGVTCAPVVPPVEFTSCSAAQTAQSAAAVLDRKLSIDVDRQPLGTVVERLQKGDHLPISFLEDAAAPVVSEHLHEVGARAALEAMLSRFPGYRCLVANGHVLIVGNAPEYQATVSGLTVERKSPWIAANMYLGKLATLPAFRDLNTYVERPSDPSLLNDEVSLAGKGSVVEHLVQLLGENPRAFFTIRRLSPMGRALTLGSVP